MSARIATYNNQQLGDIMVPLIPNELDFSIETEWGIQVTPIFESNAPVLRYIGPVMQRITLRFIKDVYYDSQMDTHQARHDEINNIISSCTPTIGSTAGANLVITDGVKAMTWTGAMPKSFKEVRNDNACIMIEAVFEGKQIA